MGPRIGEIPPMPGLPGVTTTSACTSPPSRNPPKLWEMVGADVFEYSYNDSDEKPMKIKGCVWHDRASGTASVSMMQKYSEHWEPSSAQIIRCFMQNWLQHYLDRNGW